LIFEVLEQYQNSVMEEAIGRFRRLPPVKSETFASTMPGLLQNVRRSFLMTLLENRELEYLFRKLPEDRMKEHQAFDERMATEWFRHACRPCW